MTFSLEITVLQVKIKKITCEMWLEAIIANNCVETKRKVQLNSRKL